MEDKNIVPADIIMVLDASGSMRKSKHKAICGYNSFLKQQKDIKGKALLTTIFFNNEIKTVHDRIDINYAMPITAKEYNPGGATALLDAIGMAIEKADEAGNPKTFIAIITDGFENASSKYSYSQIKSLAERRQKENGLRFAFFSLNIDAMFEASRIGIPSQIISSDGKLDFSVISLALENFRNNV